MSKFKPKKDPVNHEKSYIEYLEKQLTWLQSQETDSAKEAKMKELKYKLSKARLVLKLLTSK